MIIAIFIFYGCDALEDEINEKTKKTENFTEDLMDEPGIPVTNVKGACSPALDFDTLLSSVPIWNDVKEHISEVKVNSLAYSVMDNNNTTDGWVGIYVTDSDDYFIGDKGAPPETDMVGFTENIEAGVDYKDELLVFTTGGQDILEEAMLNYETPFSICAQWSGSKNNVDMKFLLTEIDIDVTFVPLK